MYAKISGNTVTKFPYTFGDLRKDHPNVSFPKNITATIMKKYGMVGVLEGPKPTLGTYQVAKREALPRRPVLGADSDGLMILANYWMIHYNAAYMFDDITGTDSDGNEIVVKTRAEQEAEYQATLDAKAAATNRETRDSLLAETDYLALSDTTLTAEMTTYRQALRDITSHDNWPHLADEDWPVKP